MDKDIIKSYLVQLGYEIDNESYKKFKDALDGASKEVSSKTGKMMSSIATQGAGFAAAMVAIVASTSALLKSLAKADLGYEKYAMRMFMAKERAKEFQIVTKAMGESIEDIRWIPELQKQYSSLMSHAKQMELPKEYSQNMKLVRSLGFEFTRLKVEAVYGLQWIGHNLVKNLMEPIMGSKSSFAKFNDYLSQNLPAIAKKIADVLGPIIEIIMDVGRAIKGVIKWVGKLWNSLSSDQKKVILATLAAMALAAAPVTTAFALIVALISEMFALFEGKQTLIPSGVLRGTLDAIDLLIKALKILWRVVESVMQVLTGVFSAFVSHVEILFEVVATKSLKPLLKLNRVFEDTALGMAEGMKKIWDKPLTGVYEHLSEDQKKNIALTDEQRAQIVNNALSGQTQQGGMSTSGYGAQGTLNKEEIMAAAIRVSEKTDIPANLIYSQWWGETNGFKQYEGRFNLGNMKKYGGKGYRDFGSLDEFGDFFSNQIKKNWPGAIGAQTPEELAIGLKSGLQGGYAEVSPSHYAGMIRGNMDKFEHSTTVGSITFNINGARDPKAVANEVSATVQRTLRIQQPPISDYMRRE